MKTFRMIHPDGRIRSVAPIDKQTAVDEGFVAAGEQPAEREESKLDPKLEDLLTAPAAPAAPAPEAPAVVADEPPKKTKKG